MAYRKCASLTGKAEWTDSVDWAVLHGSLQVDAIVRLMLSEYSQWGGEETGGRDALARCIWPTRSEWLFFLVSTSRATTLH